MLKSLTCLEYTAEERLYQFLFPPTATLGELHDTLFKMMDFVIHKINEAQTKAIPNIQEKIEKDSEKG